MRNTLKIKLLLVIAGLISAPGAAQATSLLEVYQQALQSDPAIHEAEAIRLAAMEAAPQARSLLLPQINGSGSWSTVDQSGSSFNINTDSTVPFTQDTDDTQWGVTLRQTVFRWDQVVGLRRADKTVAKAEANREAAQQDLILRVAQRYFDVLAAEDRLTSNIKNRIAIDRRLEQAKQRFDVGLIAITDVQESQAAYDQAVANTIAAKRALATAREFLREITGEYLGDLDAPGENFPLSPLAPAVEGRWVDLSLSQNLNLIASRLDEELARDEISFRRNGYYPSIDLVATHGETTREGTATSTFGGVPNTSIVDTDGTQDSIRVEINVPIFAGGGNRSRVREAVYLHRASREQLQRITRATERQARDAFLGVQSERSRVNALKQAVQSSQTALEATQAGYEVGTRTIVEVLNSQFSLYDAITNYYQSRYDFILNVLRLKDAAGTLQVQDLEQIDQWLVDRPSPEEEVQQDLEDGEIDATP